MRVPTNQRCEIRRLVLGNDSASIVAAIAGAGTTATLPMLRSDHDLMSLIKVIRVSFPVVCRLMNGRSDCDAIHEYVRDNAAQAGALLDCGEFFRRCLEQFPAVDALPYLPDLARFEWAREVALGAPQLAIDRSVPRNIGEDDILDAGVAFHPSLSFIETMWPIDDIWEAGRTAGGRLPAISATTRTIRVLVFRRGATADSMRLTHARMSFMQALRCGNSVRDAAALALRADDRFDPLIILGDLFKRGVIVELIPAGQRP